MSLYNTPSTVASIRLSRQAGTVAMAVSLALGAALPIAASAAEADLDEVVVTAQRREQNILDVPLSVASYSALQMEQQGINGIEDLARLTPSLRFTKTSGVSGNNGSDISIRGIASDVGAGTTAIYIDDTPIQIRSIGYFGGNTYPLVSDLERIEVLRGPQGTLFGAGAEGGAVRFLTPSPSFDKSSLTARAELASIDNGGMSNELGVAGGMALSDTVAFRGSLWFRHEGGYIDRYDPTMSRLITKDVDASDNYSGRAALAWKATENLTLTPALFYQRTNADGRSQYWEVQSDLSDADYRTGIYNPEPSSDHFTMPSLKIEYDMGGIQLISNTSYFDRSRVQSLDYATFLSTLRSGSPFGTYGNKDPLNAVARQTLDQQNTVQEVRLVSASPEQFIDWTAGLYYSKAEQDSLNLSGSGRIPGVISSGFPQYLGRYNLYDAITSTDKQYAGYGSVDVKPSPGLTLTAGARLSKNKFYFGETRDGPVNGGVRNFVSASQNATAFTPKIGANYKLGDNNMVYGSVSKGYRPGGAQAPVDPSFCAADLATLGLTASPREFSSDSLWAYELGTKNSLMDGAVVLDLNAYYIKWKNIQQSVRLPRCSFAFISNLGEASGKGADLSLAFKPAQGLQLGASLGYNLTKYDEGVTGGNGLIIRQEGDRIGGPKFTGSVFGMAEKQLSTAIEGYMRFDYTFQGSGIPQNPLAFGYDAGLTTLPSTNSLSLRTGIRFSLADVSLFANNLTNSHDALARAHDTTTSPLYYAQSYQPRTIGVSVQVTY